MKLQKLLSILFVSGSAWVVAMNAAIAEDSQVSSGKIPYPNQVEFLRKSAYQLVQTPNVEPIPITGVKANPTEKGVEVILETTQGEQLQVTNRSTDNNFIADIPNAQLRLSSGDAFTFRSEKPIAGITEITVVNVNANTVRVTVVGENALPTVELFDDNAGLVFGVTSAQQRCSHQKHRQPEKTRQMTHHQKKQQHSRMSRLSW
jgi:iron complex outermembrane recepter protein